MKNICLSRKKQDVVNGKPLVQLPEKNIETRELEFTDDEKKIYDIFHEHGKKIILRYKEKSGTENLLKLHRFHIFEIMLRLRQFCCHKKLLPKKWRNLDVDELMQMVLDDDFNENSIEAKRLSQQLRDMIRDGMGDSCSICLSEMDQPRDE